MNKLISLKKSKQILYFDNIHLNKTIFNIF
jgi:hypothetical protein